MDGTNDNRLSSDKHGKSENQNPPTILLSWPPAYKCLTACLICQKKKQPQKTKQNKTTWGLQIVKELWWKLIRKDYPVPLWKETRLSIYCPSIHLSIHPSMHLTIYSGKWYSIAWKWWMLTIAESRWWQIFEYFYCEKTKLEGKKIHNSGLSNWSSTSGVQTWKSVFLRVPGDPLDQACFKTDTV